jgi:hypothetical protein
MYLDLTPDHLGLYVFTTDKWVKSRIVMEKLTAHPHFHEELFCDAPRSQSAGSESQQLSTSDFTPKYILLQKPSGRLLGTKGRGLNRTLRRGRIENTRKIVFGLNKHGLANTDKTSFGSSAVSRLYLQYHDRQSYRL